MVSGKLKLAKQHFNSNHTITELPYLKYKSLCCQFLVLIDFFFYEREHRTLDFFFFFYEREHRTGTMCPFSSLHPLEKEKKCNEKNKTKPVH